MTDEQALAAAFAALVEESPPSEVSPLAVIRLAMQQQRERTARRLRIGRNVLLAAVFVAAVVVVVPRLGHSSSTEAASSSSRAYAPYAPYAAAGSADQSAGSGTPAPVAGDAPTAGSSAPAAAAGSSTSAAGSSAAASGGLSLPAAGSAAAAASAVAGRAPTVAPHTAQPASGCAVLPAKAAAAAKAAFPPGTFGATTTAPGCDLYGATLAPATPGGTTVTVRVRKAATGRCLHLAVPCAPTAGHAYQRAAAGSAPTVWVYGNGYEVALTSTGGPDDAAVAARLVAAGHAVIAALG